MVGKKRSFKISLRMMKFINNFFANHAIAKFNVKGDVGQWKKSLVKARIKEFNQHGSESWNECERCVSATNYGAFMTHRDVVIKLPEWTFNLQLPRWRRPLCFEVSSKLYHSLAKFCPRQLENKLEGLCQLLLNPQPTHFQRPAEFPVLLSYHRKPFHLTAMGSVNFLPALVHLILKLLLLITEL